VTRPEFPTPWQRKTLWVAIASFSVVLIGAIAVGLIWLTSRVLGFLQPILIPFAIAAVMAYLLDPVVSWIVAWGSRQTVARIITWGTTRQRAVMLVFGVVTLALIGILIWIVPAISKQTENLVHRVPGYTRQVKRLTVKFAQTMEERTHLHLFPALAPVPALVPADAVKDPANDKPAVNEDAKPKSEVPATPTAPTPAAPPAADEASKEAPDKLPQDASELPSAEAQPPVAPARAATDAKPGSVKVPADLQYDWDQLMSGEWVRTALPVVLRKTWDFVTESVGGFLGIFGFLLSMIIVPVYLYYFLIESRQIAETWDDYLPLRASAFKDEVVSALEEINGYLIAFFRGQLLVSLINGSITGLGLVIVGLDFGLLIGLLLCVLNLIPYLGIMICWVPAVIIASVQGGVGTWVPGDPWWLFPLVVTAIFVVVQQVDGLIVTPKIVGGSVGLHPMTVIVSVFVWSLLMGGLLGAILAVPMTATLKVLLRRYVWERRFKGDTPLPVEESLVGIRVLPPEGEPVHGK
jgi:predicted PurR-regulated permease PerM